MIIVSQDKDEIVNFDNITSIVVNDVWDDKPGQVLKAIDVRGSRHSLGYYKNEKRAKEVLQRIATAIAYDGLLRLPKVEPKRSVSHEELMKMFKYEMPEE